MQGRYDEALTTPEFFANPYPMYHRLRDEAPVYWCQAWGGWVLTRYADALAILQDPQRFSNAGRQTGMLSRLPAATRASLKAMEEHYSQAGLSNLDPPDHKRLRVLINKAFTPRIVERLRGDIESMVERLMNECETADEVDLIRQFAFPLPALVIARLLGLPEEDLDQFKAWSDDVTVFLGSGRATADNAERGQHSLLELRRYMAHHIALRREKPAADLMSSLLAAEERGEVLSDGEMLGTCITILLGGHETTTNLIGNGTLALLRHPAAWARLREHPELIPAAVEELLRYDSPVQRSWRVATEDVELGGQPIRKGQFVYGMIGAANRDPAQFPEPDQLDIERDPNRHLTFGYGIHFCLGAPLARLEAAIALEAFVKRWPGLQLAPGAGQTWHENMAFHGQQSMPVQIETAMQAA